MFPAPSPLGEMRLSTGSLKRDFNAKMKIGPCAIGKEAVYLNSFFLDCRYYVPYAEIRRVFKRVAMSEGGFTRKGSFGSLPYLVVLLEDGREKQCSFRHEEEVDIFLREIGKMHPEIPTVSEAAEKRLAKARAAEEARYVKELSPEAEDAIKALRRAKAFLEEKPEIPERLSAAAKDKRVMDNMNPLYQYAALAVFLLSAAALVIGIVAFFRHESHALYMVLFGMAFLFFTMSAQVLPTGRRNSRHADRMWEEALEASAAYIAGCPDFPLPAQYAHPAALDRMIRVIREGRAETAGSARQVMEADLKAINSSVTVSQLEYDEIMAIKPMYLVCDYR